jgi:hypothetical protein
MTNPWIRRWTGRQGWTFYKELSPNIQCNESTGNDVEQWSEHPGQNGGLVRVQSVVLVYILSGLLAGLAQLLRSGQLLKPHLYICDIQVGLGNLEARTIGSLAPVVSSPVDPHKIPRAGSVSRTLNYSDPSPLSHFYTNTSRPWNI